MMVSSKFYYCCFVALNCFASLVEIENLMKNEQIVFSLQFTSARFFDIIIIYEGDGKSRRDVKNAQFDVKN